MNQLLIDRFKDYVNIHYSDHNLKITDICSNIYCSQSCLHRLITYHYGYSIMKYVEYVRILKSIELTYYYGEKKVYLNVGYKSHSTFCKSFFRVTKLHTSDFLSSKIKENKKVAREAYKLAKENPKKAIEIILEDVSERSMLSKWKWQKWREKKRLKKTIENLLWKSNFPYIDKVIEHKLIFLNES